MIVDFSVKEFSQPVKVLLPYHETVTQL